MSLTRWPWRLNKGACTNTWHRAWWVVGDCVNPKWHKQKRRSLVFRTQSPWSRDGFRLGLIQSPNSDPRFHLSVLFLLDGFTLAPHGASRHFEMFSHHRPIEEREIPTICWPLTSTVCQALHWPVYGKHTGYKLNGVGSSKAGRGYWHHQKAFEV